MYAYTCLRARSLVGQDQLCHFGKKTASPLSPRPRPPPPEFVQSAARTPLALLIAASSSSREPEGQGGRDRFADSRSDHRRSPLDLVALRKVSTDRPKGPSRARRMTLKELLLTWYTIEGDRAVSGEARRAPEASKGTLTTLVAAERLGRRHPATTYPTIQKTKQENQCTQVCSAVCLAASSLSSRRIRYRGQRHKLAATPKQQADRRRCAFKRILRRGMHKW